MDFTLTYEDFVKVDSYLVHLVSLGEAEIVQRCGDIPWIRWGKFYFLKHYSICIQVVGTDVETIFFEGGLTHASKQYKSIILELISKSKSHWEYCSLS